MEPIVRQAVGVALVMALALVAVAAPALVPVPGDPAPELKGILLADGSRKQFHFDEHELTIVNFWGTWCPPCRDELPRLEALRRDLGEDAVQVVGVMVDSISREEADAFLEEMGVTFPNLRSNVGLLRSWGGITLFPTTYLVGKDGAIVRRYVGATAEQIDGLEADVRNLMAGRELGTMEVLSGSSSDPTRTEGSD